MIRIDIPGGTALRLEDLVLDFNGTLACDGVLLAGVRERLEGLSESIRIHVVTADTFGRARVELADLRCQLCILEPSDQARAKLQFVARIGAERTACIGNGRNDALMMDAAALSIAVVQAEGAAVQTLSAADVVARDIGEALDLLLNPQRLVATLRT
jgi:soluble P-type ATPase